MRNKKVILAIMLIVLFGVVGTTIAYYTSQDTFTNEFNTGKYVIKAQEIFESPDKWLPGETTPKKISVTNQGNVDAAVKVCFREKWEDENGNSLPLTKNDFPIAILNYKQGFKNFWLQDCNSNCYYYYKKLGPNETTEDLLESVTYNPNINFSNTRTCTTDPTTHKTTCINSVDDYSGGKYTLTVDIETVQYDQYENHFGNIVAEQGGICKDLNINKNMPTHFSVVYKLSGSFWFKESELDNYVIDTSSCEVHYTNTISPENKYYTKCSKAYYIDDGYEPNQQVNVKAISYRNVDCISEELQLDGSYLCTLESKYEGLYDYWEYGLDGYAFDNDIELFDNLTNTAINDWNDGYSIYLTATNLFRMPNHVVFFRTVRSEA